LKILKTKQNTKLVSDHTNP